MGNHKKQRIKSLCGNKLDYRGEVLLFFANDSDSTFTFKKGDRVAQMVVQPYFHCRMVEVENLSKTGRGEGGYGSTGR